MVYRGPTVLRVVPKVPRRLTLRILPTLFLITTTPLVAVFITRLTLVLVTRVNAGPTIHLLPISVICILETGYLKGTLSYVSVYDVVKFVNVLGRLILLVENRTMPINILVRKLVGNKGCKVWLIKWYMRTLLLSGPFLCPAKFFGNCLVVVHRLWHLIRNGTKLALGRVLPVVYMAVKRKAPFNRIA